jgi:hypothetical protein
MTPGVNPTPQKREIGWISRTLLRSPPLNHIPGNYILAPCVTGNICNTLDMAPGVNPSLDPSPQKWESGWISRKLLRSPPLSYIYSCSLCYRQYIEYIRYCPRGQPFSPEMGNWLNISKTVEIPTPKPYIFLFLVSRNIWWYVDHDHTGWSHPHMKQEVP